MQTQPDYIQEAECFWADEWDDFDDYLIERDHQRCREAEYQQTGYWEEGE